jgi:hypothetical protein
MSDEKEPKMPDHYPRPNTPQAGETLHRPDGTVLHVDEVIVEVRCPRNAVSTKVRSTELDTGMTAEYWKITARNSAGEVLRLEAKLRDIDKVLSTTRTHASEDLAVICREIDAGGWSVAAAVDGAKALRKRIRDLETAQTCATCKGTIMPPMQCAHCIDAGRQAPGMGVRPDMVQLRAELTQVTADRDTWRTRHAGAESEAYRLEARYNTMVADVLRIVRPHIDNPGPIHVVDAALKLVDRYQAAKQGLITWEMERDTVRAELTEKLNAINNELIQTKGKLEGARGDIAIAQITRQPIEQNLASAQALIGKIRTALNINLCSDISELLAIGSLKTTIESLRRRIIELCALVGLVKDGKPFDDGSSLKTEIEFLVEQSMMLKAKESWLESELKKEVKGQLLSYLDDKLNTTVKSMDDKYAQADKRMDDIVANARSAIMQLTRNYDDLAEEMKKKP